MKILKTCEELVAWRGSLDINVLVGFVPTMGAMHDGHLSLILSSIKDCDLTVVSIFLNPKQFGENEDLDSYPVDLDGDLDKISNLGVAAVFVPSVSEIYSDGDAFTVKEEQISKMLEGKSRPHFFDGVLTVVSKLFNMVMPGNAYFGLKDAQQLVLIEKMVDSMKYSINIVRCKTIRESSGLAMSSRNKYLNKNDRNAAAIIYSALSHAKKLVDSGEMSPVVLKNYITETILSEPGFSLDYVSVVDMGTFQECEKKN